MKSPKLNHANEREEYQRRMDRVLEVVVELKKETDRGLAVLGAALLDERLKTILHSFLIQGKHLERLFEGANSPLGTFSAKTSMACALGLISVEEYQNIEIIRKIRNDFAHKFDLNFSFNDASISDRCNNFSLTKYLKDRCIKFGRDADAKAIFSMVIADLDCNLIFREEHAQYLRFTAPDWQKFLFSDEII